MPQIPSGFRQNRGILFFAEDSCRQGMGQAGFLADLNAVRMAMKRIKRAYFVYPLRLSLVEVSAVFAQASNEAGVEIIANISQKPARPNARSRQNSSYLTFTLFCFHAKALFSYGNFQALFN
jgi:hypothetical protein